MLEIIEVIDNMLTDAIELIIRKVVWFMSCIAMTALFTSIALYCLK